jgi:hydroxymethylpyrimidine/phosphomethylpyrimidine kinase
MSTPASGIPVVLVFAGLDPTGGAGIEADIEAIASMGCHTAPVVTALTVQDTQRVLRFVATDNLLLVEQARSVLEDIPIQAIKIGMVGSVGNAEVLHSILIDYPEVPVVMDPALSAGGGGALADEGIVDALRALLLPQITVLTPNAAEARRLAPAADTLDACAQELQSLGCEYVLITGADENTPQVENILYGNHRRLEAFSWQRLPHSYHGSGCTLAASLAGLLAQGREPLSAIHEAQEYTWEALKEGYRIGMGQLIPNRLFWARGE